LWEREGPVAKQREGEGCSRLDAVERVPSPASRLSG
jgi:hypothetical protein